MGSKLDAGDHERSVQEVIDISGAGPLSVMGSDSREPQPEGRTAGERLPGDEAESQTY